MWPTKLYIHPLYKVVGLHYFAAQLDHFMWLGKVYWKQWLLGDRMSLFLCITKAQSSGHSLVIGAIGTIQTVPVSFDRVWANLAMRGIGIY